MRPIGNETGRRDKPSSVDNAGGFFMSNLNRNGAGESPLAIQVISRNELTKRHEFGEF
jgi:hypothetical protein